jgi:hypothetical protein
MINECVKQYGIDFYYIPRTLVGRDEILGEDRLFQFKDAYPVKMYMENHSGFEGSGSFIAQFGHLVNNHTATLTIPKLAWEECVGQYESGILPNRPSEGDLLYFPLTKGLFTISFVEHKNPFYQLGKLYVYKLSIETFTYSSERLDTGIEEIDVIENLKTFSDDLTVTDFGGITSITMDNIGSGYTYAIVGYGRTVNNIDENGFVQPGYVTISYVGFNEGSGAGVEFDNTYVEDDYVESDYTNYTTGYDAELRPIIVDGKIVRINIINSGHSFTEVPIITITGDGIGASATATCDIIVDNVGRVGDNQNYLNESEDIQFSVNSLFGGI